MQNMKVRGIAEKTYGNPSQQVLKIFSAMTATFIVICTNHKNHFTVYITSI